MSPFKGECEFLDRSDFHDFYTIKALQEGDFGVLKKNYKYLGVHLRSQNSLCISSV